MQRRSARLKEKPLPSYAFDVDILSDEELGSNDADKELPLVEEVEQTKRGRKRKSEVVPNDIEPTAEEEKLPKKKKLRGNKGAIQSLLDMPLDILFEVLGSLEPWDLLSVARTTKSVRSIVMSRQALSVWKRSFGQLDPTPPECPSDLSYPEYAELAFGKSCYFCQRNMGAACLYMSWRARVRACARCLGDRALFIEDKHLPSVVADDYPLEIARCLPAITSYNQKTVSHFFRSYHDQWRLEYQELTEESKEEWIINKITEAALAVEDTANYLTWSCNWAKNSKERQSTIIEQRKELVVDKIKEMGWGEELSKIPDSALPQNFPEIVKVCQKEVTPRILNNLEPLLNIFMQIARRTRLAKERESFLGRRLLSLEDICNQQLLDRPPGSFLPTSVDLYKDEIVKAIVDDQNGEEGLTDEDCLLLKNGFANIVKRWHKRTETALLDILEEASGQPNNQMFEYNPTTVLDLATTFFSCKGCGAFSTTEQAKRHYCTRQDSYGSHLNNDLLTIKRTIKKLPWNTNEYIHVRISILKQLACVLEECGLDPTTTTAEEMQKSDPIFECLEHGNDKNGRCTMGWQSLCKHLQAMSHPKLGTSDKTFIILGDEEATNVRLRILESQERYFAKRMGTTSICVHCRHKGSVYGLRQHVRTEHGISKPTMENDIVLLPETFPPEPSFWLWPPRDPEEVLPSRE